MTRRQIAAICVLAFLALVLAIFGLCWALTNLDG